MTAVKALRELAALKATGALHVEGAPASVVYLREGQVCHVDAEAAPGVGQVLTASGRLSDDVWQSVLTVGAPAGRVAALLVEQGYLSQGELELCANGALFDAAFFALGSEPASVRFASGQASWFGGALSVDVERLIRETGRRRELLSAALPTSVFDGAPVVPVARMPRDQVVLDGLRWELLVHADGRRTPTEIAALLGRGAYASLLEVRRLAAIGLLQPPPEAAPVPIPTVTAYRPAVSGSRLAGPRLPADAPATRPAAASAASPSSTPRPYVTRPNTTKTPEAPPVGSAAVPRTGSAASRPSGTFSVTPAQPDAPRPNATSTSPSSSLASALSPTRPLNPQPVPEVGTGQPADAPTAPSAGPPPPLPKRDTGGLPPLPKRGASGELPPLPRRVTGSRVVRPSQGGRTDGADGDDPGGRWPSPPPEVRAEAPSLASLTRVRDALQEFS
ncbi:DUF4388 domain-containing protein [Cryptosporangium phraense]|uniref:PatA-like N-terminal domain-containing protein n=1 Tax=Cryptosporangium phraense TaxID=2593070 RepID=A0A545AQV8_9ACTN|nr:DUF4388 domain-containing protein [Cryptosporangium phraense]TQS43663.1 hypothetical protein FL583_18710 [Cryptosporangium phraense]